MTPEQELIEAVLGATILAPVDCWDIDAILTTPSVQAALAKVRDREPVLRWEREGSKTWRLLLGGELVSTVEQKGSGHYLYALGGILPTQSYDTLTEARTAAEQAVRDWLKRAGCV